jgi:heme exporter protein CcmD
VSGVISGGWEFVVGAYAWTAIVLGIYLLSVVSRHRREFANLERQAARGPEVE